MRKKTSLEMKGVTKYIFDAYGNALRNATVKILDGVNFDLRNLVIWLIGFIVYRLLMRVDIVVGYTLPDMLLTMALCLAADKLLGKREKTAV